jgi:hypothetical protein
MTARGSGRRGRKFGTARECVGIDADIAREWRALWRGRRTALVGSVYFDMCGLVCAWRGRGAATS